MYKKLSFADDTSAAYVVSIVREGVRVDKDIQAKFIKIIII